MIESKIEALNKVFSDYLALSERNIGKFLSLNEDLLSSFSLLLKRAKEQNRKKSIDFNVLNFFSIDEKKHSYIIAYLLTPTEDHGQGKLFLNLFLKRLEIFLPAAEEDEWVVTAEKGRIDIMLRRDKPHSVIIDENKSNNADDQPNQLYRYWHNMIFWPNRHKENPIQYISEHSDCYKIIYLAPNGFKQFSLDSVTKPSYLNSDKLPKKIDGIDKWSFNEQIVGWLKDSCEKLDKENHRLREFIIQYLEYWEKTKIEP